jgi:hypothetical protein
VVDDQSTDGSHVEGQTLPRLILGTLGAIVIALVWAVLASLMGAPSIVITVGAVAIGAGVYTYVDRRSN